MTFEISKDIKLAQSGSVTGEVSKDLKFKIHWNEKTIEMNNLEEAKTVCLILFRLIFERMPTL